MKSVFLPLFNLLEFPKEFDQGGPSCNYMLGFLHLRTEKPPGHSSENAVSRDNVNFWIFYKCKGDELGI